MKKSFLVLALTMVLLVLGATSAFAADANPYRTIPGAEASELNSDSGKFSDGSGPRIEANDAKNIGYIVAGNWVKFSGLNFGDPGATKVKVEAASGAAAGGTIDVFLDSATGTKIASIPYDVTGDWQKYVEVSADISGVTGTHDVVFVFVNGDINVKSVSFEGDAGSGAAAPAANPATGDNGIMLYVALAAVAAAGFVFLSRKKLVK
ncbi:carbohydrate-binding protein [Cohnella sp. GCM10027633]|uniref:carbohydrate-binding protein n=1 Tax=unclassified Cohnella TaxID=2636738 RepID=UPI003624F20E